MYSIFIDFCYNVTWDTVLPRPYIYSVKSTSTHKNGYLVAQGDDDILKSYGMDELCVSHQAILNICTLLQPSSLLQHFFLSQKRISKLEVLLTDKTVGPHIRSYLDRKMITLLELLKQSDIIITYDVDRTRPILDQRLVFYKETLSVQLYFEKIQTGIQYYLSVHSHQERIPLVGKSIHILSFQPAMLIIEGAIVYIDKINTHKLKPFFKKESIFIPKTIIGDYVDKFLKEIIKDIDVDVAGFDINIEDKLESVSLSFEYDLTQDKWLCSPVFNYTSYSFNHHIATSCKTLVKSNGFDDLSILKVKRDKASEQRCIEKLLEWGLVETPTHRFSSGNFKYAIFEWVNTHYNELSPIFSVNSPTIESNKLHFGILKESITFENESDWFDLKGYLETDDGTRIPIVTIINCLKKGLDFVQLADQSLLLIPQKLRAIFDGILSYCDIVNDRIRIAKKYKGLVEHISTNAVESFIVIDKAVPKDIPVSPKLCAELRPYQMEGYRWLAQLYRQGLGGCLADDMGLGKTVQIIALLCHIKDNMVSQDSAGDVPIVKGQLSLFDDTERYSRQSLKALVIVPTSLQYNWLHELQRFAPSLMVCTYNAKSRIHLSQTLGLFDVTIVSYQTLLSDIDFFALQAFNVIIMDESQYVKNNQSKTFKAINTLSVPNRFSISGTPIENSLGDLWSQMQVVNPNLLKSYTYFKSYFQNPIEKENNASKLDELKSLVHPFILRRTKGQVATDLPDLIEIEEFIDMTHEEEEAYTIEKSKIRNQIFGLDKKAQAYKIHVLTGLMHLRQLALDASMVFEKCTSTYSSKTLAILNDLRDIVKSGQKVIVFSSFVKYLDILRHHLENENIQYRQLYGSDTAKDRQKAINDFQNDDNVPIFLISIKSGGVGLNLTRADYIFISDPWWNPFLEKQAIARAHRIGRQSKVVVKRYITNGTLEHKILQLQSKKNQLSDAIIPEATIPDIFLNELDDIL